MKPIKQENHLKKKFVNWHDRPAKIRSNNCSLINQKIGTPRLKSCVAGGLNRLTSIPKSPDVAADNLNKFFASIVQSLLSLSDQLSTEAF